MRFPSEILRIVGTFKNIDQIEYKFIQIFEIHTSTVAIEWPMPRREEQRAEFV